MRVFLSLVVMGGLVGLIPSAFAANAKNADPQVETDPPPPKTEINACGCYRDDKDMCHCQKVKRSQLKCECDGDCEPPECVAKRAQDSEKAAAAALKKIAERDKKAQAEAKAAQAKRDKEAAEAKAKKEKGSEGSSGRWK
jgi:hypothetical protein